MHVSTKQVFKCLVFLQVPLEWYFSLQQLGPQSLPGFRSRELQLQFVDGNPSSRPSLELSAAASRLDTGAGVWGSMDEGSHSGGPFVRPNTEETTEEALDSDDPMGIHDMETHSSASEAVISDLVIGRRPRIVDRPSESVTFVPQLNLASRRQKGVSLRMLPPARVCANAPSNPPLRSSSLGAGAGVGLLDPGISVEDPGSTAHDLSSGLESDGDSPVPGGPQGLVDGGEFVLDLRSRSRQSSTPHAASPSSGQPVNAGTGGTGPSILRTGEVWCCASFPSCVPIFFTCVPTNQYIHKGTHTLKSLVQRLCQQCTQAPTRKDHSCVVASKARYVLVHVHKHAGTLAVFLFMTSGPLEFAYCNPPRGLSSTLVLVCVLC